MDALSDTTEPTRAAAAPDAPAKNADGEAALTQAARWRPPVLTPPPAIQHARNPSLPTFAGLMTLILTFFIVLTSISLHDQDKSKAAIASVQQAFGNAVAEGPRARSDEEIARDYIAGLARRIQSLVPMMGGKRAPGSDHQVLWLPADLAFRSDGAMAPVFPTVLREVVNSLDGIPRRLTPHLEMRLCATEPSEQLRARAVAIGAALAGEKAPLGQFSIGVEPCDPAYLGIAVALAPAAGEQAP
jgi:hypothetical protein